MYRYSNSKSDYVRNSIIQCMTVSKKQAYEVGKEIILEYKNEIMELQSLEYLFCEPYLPTRNAEYNSSIRIIEKVLRKYRTYLESVEDKKEVELERTKKDLAERESDLDKTKKELTLKTADYEKIQEDALKWESKAKASETEYRSLRERYDDNMRELRDARATIDSLRMENSKLQTEIKQLMSENALLYRQKETLGLQTKNT